MKNLILTLTLFSALNISAQVVVEKDTNAIQFAKTITSADLKEYLSVLASDEYEGRETGKKGQKMAAEYISDHFSEWGLSAIDANKNYLQEFELMSLKFKSASINDGTLYRDFLFYGLENVNIENKEVVFVGYGIEEENYNNYDELDVKGKVVLFLEGEPTLNGKSVITGSQELSDWASGSSKKIELAEEKGAISSVLISAQSADQFMLMASRLKHYYEHPGLVQKGTTRNSRFSVSEDFAAKLFNISPKKLNKLKSKLNKKASAVTKVKSGKISINLNIEEGTVNTENVVGMVQGTDLAAEVIVISAHYDHIGVRGDRVFNGADDDGSGTVAVMELAQAFAEAKKAGHGPRRSILFMGMTGEEKGLLGSEYYSENPLIPLENTVANLNIDMIGRIDEEHENGNYIYLIGTNMLSQDLHDISEETNKTYTNIELDYRFNSLEDKNRFYYRSDHYNFAKHGIPVIFYFNGVHEDYHKETDTIEKIDFNKMENISKLIFHTAWEVANRESRPKVDKTNTGQ